MANGIDLEKFKNKAKLKDRYAKQLQRLQAEGRATDSIELAVNAAVANLAKTEASSLVIYGEPQSGKTEMMICLTAKLLDEGHSTIVHLMNDSVDLLTQNLKRFKASGLAPGPRGLSELLKSSESQSPQELVVFCKKNSRDLENLIGRLKCDGKIVVIDDEADYATPNAKINQGTKTKINELVGKLIGDNGHYIGVTATPARLNLNNTLENDTAKWVRFKSHSKYTGQDVFFPLNKKVAYRRTLLPQGASPEEARSALVRFLVTVAYLNSHVNGKDDNDLGSPVWIGDSRVSVAAESSINKATVALDKGEMSFGMFDYSPDLDGIVISDQKSVETLKKLREKVGNEALPTFLIDYIQATSPDGAESLAIHTASSIEGYQQSANQEAITRTKGFIGNPQLELKKFPKAVHHIKVLYNANGKARLFYKFKGSLQFIQNLNDKVSSS